MAVYVKNGNIILQSVSYVQPVFSASYMDIQIEAEVTMPDVLAVDIVSPVDNLNLTFGKTLTDTYSGFQDVVTRGLTKPLVDSVTTLDDADVDVWIEKLLTDIQSVAESKAISLQKAPFVDAVTPLDLKAYQLAKALADVVNAPVDATAKVINKVFADSISLPDAVVVFK